MTMTSIEDYCTKTTGREGTSKERQYLHCATTSHICEDWQRYEWYSVYIMRNELEIHDFPGRKAGKATGHGHLQLRLQIPGGWNMRISWETSCKLKEHTPCCHELGIWIGDCRLSQSMAPESRYTTNHQLRTVVDVEIEDVWWAWHTRLQGYSNWMWSGWIWKLLESDIKWEGNCFRGAPGRVDCFGGAPGMVDCLGGILGLVLFGKSFRQSAI